MSDTPSKPREFWIEPGSYHYDDVIYDKETTEVVSDAAIHVVEHSALVAANAEIEQLKDELAYSGLAASAEAQQVDIQYKQIVELKAELLKAKEVNEILAFALGKHSTGNLEVFDKLKAELVEAKAELKKFKEYYSGTELLLIEENQNLKAELEQAKADLAIEIPVIEKFIKVPNYELESQYLALKDDLERVKDDFKNCEEDYYSLGRELKNTMPISDFETYRQVSKETIERLTQDLERANTVISLLKEANSEFVVELEHAKENENIKLTHIENLELEVCHLKTELEKAKAESSKWQNAAKDQDEYCDTVEQELEQAKETEWDLDNAIKASQALLSDIPRFRERGE